MTNIITLKVRRGLSHSKSPAKLSSAGAFSAESLAAKARPKTDRAAAQRPATDGVSRQGAAAGTPERLSLQAPDSVYFMGICGTAMAPLAVFLKEQGFSVAGCDQNIYPPMSSLLEENAVPVHKTPRPDSSVRLAIIGNAVSRGFRPCKT